MMQEYNTHTHTHTHTHVHMDIPLLTLVFASIKAPATSSSLTVSAVPCLAATRSAVQLLLEAGALTEAKNNVSKGISICTCVCVRVCVCVCVIFFHHSV